MKTFDVYVLNGRDANFFRKHRKLRMHSQPWKVASFITEAEANACKLGISAATQASLNNVVFLSEKDIAAFL